MPRRANLPHVKKPIDEKKPLAAWATLARAEAGMSVEEAVDALAARGHQVTAATIRGIEGGSKGASARLLRFLASVYGTIPPVQAGPDTTAGDSSAIVAAIDRLTAAVEAQGRQQQEGMLSLASVLGEVMHALGGLPGRTPDGSAGQSTGVGR